MAWVNEPDIVFRNEILKEEKEEEEEVSRFLLRETIFRNPFGPHLYNHRRELIFTSGPSLFLLPDLRLLLLTFYPQYMI